MTKAKDQRSQSMKEQAYNVDRDKDHKSSTPTWAISLNHTKESPSMNSLRGNGPKWVPCLARVHGNHDLQTWNPFRGYCLVRGRPVMPVLLFRAVPARDWA
ncbi:hypothetical protein Tco_0047883 [Tanacetum coccineum]